MFSFNWSSSQPVTGHLPQSRTGATLTTLANSQGGCSYVLYGGHANCRLNDVHTLVEGPNGTWIWKLPDIKGHAPKPTLGHSACVIKKQGRSYLLVYGGQNGKRQCEAISHVLDLETFKWKRLYISHVPPARCHASFCHGPQGSNCVFMFGGRSSPEGLRFNDLWCLDYSNCDVEDKSQVSSTSISSGSQ